MGMFAHTPFSQSLKDLTLTNTGSHTVRATAYHPLSRTNASTTNSFTVVDGSGSVTNTYDAAGNVVGRQLPGGRTQALVWDGGGRLVTATERDASNNGWNWSALYDGLGRRLRTVHTPVVGGSPSGTTTTTDAWFDPQVEFMEVAVGVNGSRTWAIHGPDLSGRYGGAQGIGGLEGTIRESDGTKRGAVSDHFGNVVASIAGLELSWNGTRVTGYGPVAGQPVPWLGAGKELTEVSVWRSRRLDPTGFYWLGARYYEPGSGRFLSPDPFGHEASMSLYDYANGDPVNRLDPSGRASGNFYFPGQGDNAPPAITITFSPANGLSTSYPSSDAFVLGGGMAFGGGVVAGAAYGGYQLGALGLAGARAFGGWAVANYVPTTIAGEKLAMASAWGAFVNGTASAGVKRAFGGNWQEVGNAFLGGAVSGAITGPAGVLGAGLTQTVGLGVAASGIGNTIEQGRNNGFGSVSFQEQATAALLGGGAGALQFGIQSVGDFLGGVGRQFGATDPVPKIIELLNAAGRFDAQLVASAAARQGLGQMALNGLEASAKTGGEWASAMAESYANEMVSQMSLNQPRVPNDPLANPGLSLAPNPLGKKP